MIYWKKETSLLFFQKILPHLPFKREGFVSHLVQRAWCTPFFLCGRIIILPIWVLTESATKDKNIVRMNLCE